MPRIVPLFFIAVLGASLGFEISQGAVFWSVAAAVGIVLWIGIMVQEVRRA